MIIKIKKLHRLATFPSKAHDSDAGFDLFSPDQHYIDSLNRTLIKTGIAIAIPSGYCGVIKDKSGRALGEGITILGGVIDSDYRGELGIILYNSSDTCIKIDTGQKVAQLLIMPVPQVEFEEVDNLDDSVRGVGGFGSTGL